MMLAAIIVGAIALFALVVGAAMILSGNIAEDEREHCRRRHQSD